MLPLRADPCGIWPDQAWLCQELSSWHFLNTGSLGVTVNYLGKAAAVATGPWGPVACMIMLTCSLPVIKPVSNHTSEWLCTLCSQICWPES